MRDYAFGDYLREIRKQKGLSRFQPGKLIGVSDKAVSKWENGVSKPRTELFYKIGQVLDVSVDSLLEHMGSKK